jgi:cytochrome P450
MWHRSDLKDEQPVPTHGSLETAIPVRVSGFTALRYGLRFVRAPLEATRESLGRFGPLTFFGAALPFIKHKRVALLNVPLILAVGSTFNREVLSDPETWRSVSFFPGGPRNSAARRLSQGLTRLTGPRHDHYRSLITPPLRRPRVNELGERMLQLVRQLVASWPLGTPINLVEWVDRLVQDIGLELLFGADGQGGRPIAELAARLFEQNWSLGVAAFPINLPITPYGRYVRDAAMLEHRVLAWAAGKRGRNEDDLAAIIVNSSDLDGAPSNDATLAGLLPTVVVAAFEACVSALLWALILIAQHPRVARQLLEELSANASDKASSDALTSLPLLDAVVKETMRILPPVPLHFRVAQRDTSLLGHAVPNGSRLILSAFLTNRNPQLYQDPDDFLPERWNAINPGVFDFMAFSAGPRNCPGYWFALNVLKIALATILMRYRVALVPPVLIDYGTRPTLRPVGRVRTILHPQDGSFAAEPIGGSLTTLVRFA